MQQKDLRMMANPSGVDIEIYAGKTIYMPHQANGIPHLWFVVTDPIGNPKQVVIVNLTTRQSQRHTKWSDSTTVISPGEHPFITKASVVYYNDARIAEVKPLEEFIRAIQYESSPKKPDYYKRWGCKENCSDELLKKIQRGLLSSDFTHNNILKFAAQALNEEKP